MNIFLVCAYKFQDLAQSQKFCALSHDRETVTFRNSVLDNCEYLNDEGWVLGIWGQARGG